MKPETRPAQQLVLAFEASALQSLGAMERIKAVRLLGQLLLEASGGVVTEDADEDV